MTKEEIASLALKLTGIYCLVHLVQLPSALSYTVGQFASWYRSGPGTMPLYEQVYVSSLMAGSILTLLLYGAVGLILIRFSNPLARYLVRESPTGAASSSVAVSSQEAQAIAFAVLGVYLIITSLSGLIQSLVLVILSNAAKEAASGTIHLYRAGIPGLIAESAKCVLGLILFLRAKGLVSVWRNLQGMPR